MTIVKPKPLAEYQTPWESKGEEYDPEKGKAFIHYLQTQAWEKQEAATKAAADLTKVTGERDALQGKVNEAQRANETELEKVTRERDEAKAAAAKAAEPDLEKLRLQVAVDKGLTKLQMKRLVGANLEEMTADADALLAEWKSTGAGEDGGEDEANPSTQPRTTLTNPGDPKPNSGKFDAEKAADDYVSSRSIF